MINIEAIFMFQVKNYGNKKNPCQFHNICKNIHFALDIKKEKLILLIMI